MEVGLLRKIGKSILLGLGFGSAFVCQAQKPAVSLTVSKKEVATNHTVSFTVTTNVEGSVKIDFPVSFEADLSVAAHGVEQRMDPSGKLSTYAYTQQVGQFTKEGTFTFSAYLTYRNKTYRSNKITVKVDDSYAEDDVKIKSSDPVFGIIEATKSSVYEGEPILVKAKVFSYINISYLESYNPFMAEKNMEEHVFQNGRQEVDKTKVNGKEALTFDYGKKLFIPVSTGKVKIKPYEMVLDCEGRLFSKRVRFTSSSLMINVKPLPSGAPKDFIDAVGTYTLSQNELAVKKLKQGEVFSLELIVKGIGNIHNSTAPQLNLPDGCIVYGDPERKEDVNFTEEGAVGTVTYVFNIQVTKSGLIDFPAPSFSYFDPIKEKYITVRGKGYSIDVEADKKFQAVQVKQTIGQNNSKNNGQTDVIAINKKQTPAETNWWMIGGIGAAFILLAGGSWFFIKKKAVGPKNQLPIAEENVAPKEESITELLAQQTVVSSQVSLNDLNSYIGNSSEFAVQFPQVLIAVLAQKLKIVNASREQVFSKITDTHPDIANELRIQVEKCDHFRYGFGLEDLRCEEILEAAKRNLSNIY